MRLLLDEVSRARFAADSDPAGICPNCGTALDKFQPDKDMAERLLATCGACKSWFLSEGPEGMTLQLLVSGTYRRHLPH